MSINLYKQPSVQWPDNSGYIPSNAVHTKLYWDNGGFPGPGNDLHMYIDGDGYIQVIIYSSYTSHGLVQYWW